VFNSITLDGLSKITSIYVELRRCSTRYKIKCAVWRTCYIRWWNTI